MKLGNFSTYLLPNQFKKYLKYIIYTLIIKFLQFHLVVLHNYEIKYSLQGRNMLNYSLYNCIQHFEKENDFSFVRNFPCNKKFF